MGAANCPETPRQKMIGMMYLVLTAMLALNVSMEIINAFVTVGDSMESTNMNFAKKIENSYIMFENSYKANPEKVQEQWNKAQKVKELTTEMKNYIENLKIDLVAQVDGISKQEAKKILETRGAEGVEKKDDYTVPTKFFMGVNDDGKGGKSEELKMKLKKFRQDLLTLAGDEKGQILKINLDIDSTHKDADGRNVSWETKNFYHTIAVADLVILNKYKSEVLNAEFDAVNYLYSSVSADDFKFDNVSAKVIPKSTYIIQGGTFEADVIVAAYDSKSKLRVEAGGQHLQGDTGVVRLRLGASALGEKSYSGMVYVRKETGEVGYPFSGKYFVAPPTAVVSLTQMNVFYVGVDNPITIAVEGSAPGSIKPIMTGGTITPVKANEYIVRVTQPGPAKIEVTANIGGKQQSMGAYNYRCKRIPSAKASVGKVEGNGAISRDELMAMDRILVKIPDFEFPVRLTVRSFELRTTTADNKVVRIPNESGGAFTPDMKDAIGKFRRGQRVWLDDIMVGKPDGSTETLSMSLRIL